MTSLSLSSNATQRHNGLGLMSRVKVFISHRRAEKQLSALDDHMLKDIGVSRSDISRSVWGV